MKNKIKVGDIVAFSGRVMKADSTDGLFPFLLELPGGGKYWMPDNGITAINGTPVLNDGTPVSSKETDATTEKLDPDETYVHINYTVREKGISQSIDTEVQHCSDKNKAAMANAIGLVVQGIVKLVASDKVFALIVMSQYCPDLIPGVINYQEENSPLNNQ